MDNAQPHGKTILVSTLAGKPIPEREWIVEGWIPAGCVTAIYGDGGTGKSMLAMQLLTCCASGKSFLGLPTKKVVAFGYFCEDSESELHIRQASINQHYAIEFPQLETLAWQSRVACDNVLMKFLQDGSGSATDAYIQLREEVLVSGARIVVIDTAADTFGGNENIRPQVRQFINLLNKLALEINGAVILCAHPSAAGLMRQDGTGGSTAWNNTVRSRIYLSRFTNGKSEELSNIDARDLRELAKMKSNYSMVGDKFTLRWINGAFAVEHGQAADIVSLLRLKSRNKEDEEIFLFLLDDLTFQGRGVSESKNAGTYAPKIMAAMDRGRDIGKKRLVDAMERLFNKNTIDRGYVGSGKDRKQKEGIRRRPADCGGVQHG